MFSDVKFVYVCIKSIELVIFIIYGSVLSRTKSKKEYWKKAWVPLLIFTLVEGLRFGRDIDYNVYFFRYVEIGHDFNSLDYEVLFKVIVYFFYNCGFPYWMFIVFCSFLLILSVLMLFEHFKKYLKYALPVLLFCIINSTNYIRWYLAFAFILIAISYLIKEKRIHTYIFLACAALVHVGTIMLIPIFLCTDIISRMKINPYVASVLCVLTTLTFSITSMTGLVTIGNLLLSMGLGSVSDKFGSYLMNTDAIIQGDFGHVGLREDRTLSNNIRILLAYIPLIIYGNKFVDNEKIRRLLYNVFVVGAIILPVFSTVEILDRFSSALTFFSCIVCGITLYYGLSSRNTNNYSKAILLLCFISNLWPCISVIFSQTEDHRMLFIWDANGRDFLPYWQW